MSDAARDATTITITGSDASRFEPGMTLHFSTGPGPWWRRLWHWIKRGFRKPPPPPTITVTGVDARAGVVTIGGSGAVAPPDPPDGEDTAS